MGSHLDPTEGTATNYTEIMESEPAPLDGAAVGAVERFFGAALPGDYREFLTTHGGGRVRLDHGYILDGDGEVDLTLDSLYGGEENDIVALNEGMALDFELPEATMAIGEGQSGFHELFLLHRDGSVSIWEPEYAEDNDPPRILADSFSGFLVLLAADPGES
ncbi:SMI1/KNR4 family protein [uncultured Corynebacterium sp.]|uniref:SMI1/KNR4 family protein n=1 Tax=uncultured Corynebacterium sp. TaxID=159447 RepID=UPI00259753E9|nr:SMI1/KNR4 family protein [uncultured Corynebacterium sp.]